ncbi:KR domain-containing protein [Lasiosphaeria hispida]|uniref:KR domain-containing protein n=1 Tax=Lasiosphaeria hispida TaxID=260671 RepID=A0AAJ0MFA0_9PEZI|nr:KR domain-containing protein [Lasiosphaeria hispida]
MIHREERNATGKYEAVLKLAAKLKADLESTIEWFEFKKAEVSVHVGDVTVLADVKGAVQKIGPLLAGVFHVAVVLQDGMIHSLSFEQYQTGLGAKCVGAWYLHQATLDSPVWTVTWNNFIRWSSVSAVCGNKDQGAYVAASAYMDAFMRWRCEQGLVGTAMNLGAVPTRGLVAENEHFRKSLDRNKLDILTEEELIFLVEEAVLLDRPATESINGGTSLLSGSTSNSPMFAVSGREFWAQTLKGIPSTSKLLPFVRETRPTGTHSKRMKRICAQIGATPFHFLLAAWRAYLLKYIPDGNRPHADAEAIIGYMANLLPLRFRGDFSATNFEAVISKARDVTLQALSHSTVSFDDIADAVLEKQRPAGHMALGQIAINFLSYGVPRSYRHADFDVTVHELYNIGHPSV